jgi:hypothetical protein
MRFRKFPSLAAAAVLVATAGAVVIASPAQAAGFTTRIVEYIWNVPTYSTSVGTVQCNSDEKVTGGGALVMSLNSNVRLIESFAVSDTKWQWAIHNNTNAVQEIHGRAVCITNPSGYERVWNRYTPITPNTFQWVEAFCPNGKTSISGGFQFQGGLFGDRSKVAAKSSFPHSDLKYGWAHYLRNDDIVTFTGNVQVICVSDVRRYTYDGRYDVITVPAGQSRVGTDDCRYAGKGYTWSLVGGGWSSSVTSPYTAVTAALPTDGANDYWKINAVNADSVARDFTVKIVCIARLST